MVGFIKWEGRDGKAGKAGCLGQNEEKANEIVDCTTIKNRPFHSSFPPLHHPLHQNKGEKQDDGPRVKIDHSSSVPPPSFQPNKTKDGFIPHPHPFSFSPHFLSSPGPLPPLPPPFFFFYR